MIATGSMENFLAALKAVSVDAKERGLKKGSGGHGEIKCPNCPGTIRYSVASVNGHIWACCSTPNCVRWIQ